MLLSLSSQFIDLIGSRFDQLVMFLMVLYIIKLGMDGMYKDNEIKRLLSNINCCREELRKSSEVLEESKHKLVRLREKFHQSRGRLTALKTKTKENRNAVKDMITRTLDRWSIFGKGQFFIRKELRLLAKQFKLDIVPGDE